MVVIDFFINVASNNENNFSSCHDQKTRQEQEKQRAAQSNSLSAVAKNINSFDKSFPHAALTKILVLNVCALSQLDTNTQRVKAEKSIPFVVFEAETL